MPGDKLKRVKSVKRWLDKAENSAAEMFLAIITPLSSSK